MTGEAQRTISFGAELRERVRGRDEQLVLRSGKSQKP